MLGVLVGIGIAFLAASAGERGAAAIGPARAAGGLVEPWAFEAPLERFIVTGPARAAGGLVDPSLFEAPSDSK